MHKRKRIFALFILFFLASNPLNVNAKSAHISADHLNVRSGPGTNYESIAKVNSNETYEIIQEQDGWVQIQLEQSTGWVATEYVSVSQNSSTNKKSPAVSEVTIYENNTQIRTGPSIEDDISFFANKGDVYEVMSEEGDWLKIKDENQSGFVHKSLINHQPSQSERIKGQTFVIDAGHGGYDVGAIGVNGSYEKDITYKTAMELNNMLSLLGAKVILTRENDEFIRLGSRVSLANLESPNTFISIHYNSFPEDPSASGIVSHFYDDKDKALAEHIHEQIIQSTGSRDRDALYGDYQVLRHNVNKAVLLELGFISNEKEEKLLLTDQYQKMLVRGIISGLIDYNKNK